MEYLFAASIGPIQSFIASARRTSDLYFGSLLLSELSKAAAKSVTDQCGLESLIFPAPIKREELAPSSDLNVANKIIAVINQPPQTMGELVCKAIMERLNNFKDEAYTGIRDKIYGNVADQQIKDFVEYFWVAVPHEDEKQYVETRTKLEAVMAARKNTRNFSKVEWGSYRPKSSIDGQLESVIPEKKYSEKQDSIEEKKRKARSLYIDYGAGPAERLSGVDLLKRQGAIHKGFPSTSHMATIPFLQRLTHIKDKETVTKAWEDYIRVLKPIAISPDLEQVYVFPPDPILGTYDGSLLFEERLVDIVEVDRRDQAKLQKIQMVKTALGAFYQAVDTPRPTPYYAILHADGDFMGTVIDHQQTPAAHRSLSQVLDGFARGVKAIVNQHQGALVYAGGDDVVALLPLHTVLACTRALAENFKEALKAFHNKDGQNPTLSAGIAIVHHLDPLQDSVELARKAEKKAKKEPQKNSLAITVSKRGGIDYTVVGEWGEIDRFLKDLTAQCAEDNIPDGTAYEWENLIQRLAFPDDTNSSNSTNKTNNTNENNKKNNSIRQKVLQADAVRILQRKLSPLNRDDKKAVMDLLGPSLGFTYEQSEGEQAGKVTLHEDQAEHVKLDELTNKLLLAQLLADAQRLVQPQQKQGASV